MRSSQILIALAVAADVAVTAGAAQAFAEAPDRGDRDAGDVGSAQQAAVHGERDSEDAQASALAAEFERAAAGAYSPAHWQGGTWMREESGSKTRG